MSQLYAYTYSFLTSFLVDYFLGMCVVKDWVWQRSKHLLPWRQVVSGWVCHWGHQGTTLLYPTFTLFQILEKMKIKIKIYASFCIKCRIKQSVSDTKIAIVLTHFLYIITGYWKLGFDELQLGSTAIGLKTKEGVVLAVEKRITSPLLVCKLSLYMNSLYLPLFIS